MGNQIKRNIHFWQDRKGDQKPDHQLGS